MTLIIIEFVIVLVGLAVTAVLFYRIPTLPVVNGNLSNYPTISVIIPVAVLTRRIGKFHVWAVILYPILMLVMLGVIIVSAFKKLFGLKVKWKGRSINTEEKTCE